MREYIYTSIHGMYCMRAHAARTSRGAHWENARWVNSHAAQLRLVAHTKQTCLLGEISASRARFHRRHRVAISVYVHRRVCAKVRVRARVGCLDITRDCL